MFTVNKLERVLKIPIGCDYAEKQCKKQHSIIFQCPKCSVKYFYTKEFLFDFPYNNSHIFCSL